MSCARIALVLFASLSLTEAETAWAQASPQRPRPGPRREGTSPGSVDPRAVRAEYASALLQARRYREAAAEYRRLLQQDPESFELRLNYARALAWGNAHREAEVELRRLQARAPRSAVVDELLRSVRASIEPTSREAASWVAQRPSNLAYRLALARALVREGRPRQAFEHFDVVVRRDPAPALLSEAGDAHAAAGDRAGAVDLYRRAVARAPGDVELRRAYARALAANRQYAAALEQYRLLIQSRQDPKLLVERAEIHLRQDDEVAAQRDLEASVALSPTPEAYTALADVYRWRGQFKRARAMYAEALALRPQYGRASSRLAQLAREERPDFGNSSLVEELRGVTIGSTTMADNAGFAYVAAGARVGYSLGPGTVIGLGVEPRVIYERFSEPDLPADLAAAQRIVGVAGTVGLAHTLHAEDVDAWIAGRGGAVGHSAGGAVPLLAGSAAVAYRSAWSLALEATTGPAYTEVMAAAIAEDFSSFGDSRMALLTGRTLAAEVTAPFGIADVGAGYQGLWLSDGNARSIVEGMVRLPVVSGLSLLYTGGSIVFSERSTLYWDPREYVSHALGLEYGVRTDGGVAFVARVLPGIARTVEGSTPSDPDGFGEPGGARFIGQIAGNVGLSVRSRHWETAIGAAYGTGRAGGYQHFAGNLRVRYVP